MNGILRGVCWVGLTALVGLGTMVGCNRPYYRNQADKEVYATVATATQDPRWALEDYSIEPRPESRMYDMTDPDFPALPPDDPTSHQLMHLVNGKKGWKHWHRDGDVPFVENPCWRNYLPCESDGAVKLDRRSAVDLAMTHSREFQFELEDLYLSALNVTFQRFRFDVQFFGHTETSFTAQGRLHGITGAAPASGVQSLSQLQQDSGLELHRELATGGQILAEVANSVVWQFSGPDSQASWSLLDLGFVQPLLRAGGRAVALENLTQAERTLLANIRQMSRFRQEYYVQLMNGRTPGAGPNVSGVELALLVPTGATAITTAGTGVATAGMLGILSEQQTIRNQRENVNGLISSVAQLEALYDAARISLFQVDLTRQSLFNAQSRLLASEKAFQDRLDAFKVTLGLPPDIDFRIADEMLARLRLIDPSAQDLALRMTAFLRSVRTSPEEPNAEDLERWRSQSPELRSQLAAFLDMLEDDLEQLNAALPQRRKTLQELTDRPEVKNGGVDPHILDVAALDSRTTLLKAECAKQADILRRCLKDWEQADARSIDAADAKARGESRREIRNTAKAAADQLDQLGLLQAQARLDSLTLENIDIGAQEAFEIASENRLDWMNARAALVNVWRQITVRANYLEAGLDLTFDGDLGTTGNNPTAFTSTTGSARVGLRFDAPLTRLVERNNYRTAQIEYQRARRAYYQFVDRIHQSVRVTVRQVQLDQLNFEIRRRAVNLAIAQVDRTRYELGKPPKPGDTSQLSPTIARDLTDSYNQLLNAENDLVSVFVDYESQRMNLDIDMGTMKLDRGNYWLDPGPILSDPARKRPAGEEIPAPPAWPEEPASDRSASR